jgi:hypothetical protein
MAMPCIAVGEPLDANDLLSAERVVKPRARVVVVTDPAAMQTFSPQPAAVRKMVRGGVAALLRKPTARQAWLSILSRNDTVGIKVFTAPGKIIGTRPAVVASVIEELIEVGIAPRKIIVWDKQLGPLRRAGFFDLKEQYGVRVESSTGSGWDPAVSYDSPLVGKPVWGDHEFGQKGPGVGRRSFMSRLVTQDITKHIAIVPLLNHNTAGVSGALFNLSLGSVDNTIRFEARRSGMTEAIPEIFGKPEIYDRLALVIVDALICQYQGEARNLLHYSKVLNQLRFSTDPIALDVLSINEVESQRMNAGLPRRLMSREMFENAELLELGIADPRRIFVEFFNPSSAPAQPSNRLAPETGARRFERQNN